MRRVRARGLIALVALVACDPPSAGDAGAVTQRAKASNEDAKVEVRERAPVPGGPVRTDPWTPVNAEAVRAAQSILARIVRDEALRDPDETWMLAHAIDAFGADVVLEDGAPAIDAILARATLGDGRPRFAGESGSGTLRDPHPNHTLATLLAAGVPSTRAFAVGGVNSTVADLYAAAVAAFERPSGTAWGEQAWTLRAMAEAQDAGLGAVELANAKGETFDAIELARAAAEEVVAEMRFLADARREGKAVRKRGQGIWAQPCGGLHAIEAVATWLRVRDDAELRAAVTEIRDVLAYRVGVEADLYAWMRGQAPPDLATKLDAQELKFFGHVLDAADELARAGVPLDDVVLEEARARLVAAVRRLDDSGALARVGALRHEDPQLYRDIVGDAAHAIAGLSDARPRAGS